MNATVRSLGSVLRSVGVLLEQGGIGLQGQLAYKETLNKAQTIQKFQDASPVLRGDTIFVAPNASVIGNVSIGKGSSVWYGCVIRGDVNSVSIGEDTNVQDNVMVHVAKHNAQNIPRNTVIGNRVTIGHGATIHAATIEDSSVVGMGAVVMDNSIVEKGSIVGAGSLVVPGTVVKSGQVWAGRPAAFIRNLSESELDAIEQAAMDYSALGSVHAEENSKSFGEIELDAARRWDKNTRDPDYDVQNQVDRDPNTRAMLPVGYVASS